MTRLRVPYEQESPFSVTYASQKNVHVLPATMTTQKKTMQTSMRTASSHCLVVVVTRRHHHFSQPHTSPPMHTLHNALLPISLLLHTEHVQTSRITRIPPRDDRVAPRSTAMKHTIEYQIQQPTSPPRL